MADTKISALTAAAAAALANELPINEAGVSKKITLTQVKALLLTLSATNLILGRSSGGGGLVEEIACTAAGRALIDDADAAAQRATLSAAYTLQFMCNATKNFNPIDATNYFLGFLPIAASTTAAQNKMYIRRAGIIRVAEVYYYSNTAGSNENISFYVRLNDTTDTLIQTDGVSANERKFTNSAINITVASGDFVEIKMVSPTWGTNPANGAIGGYLLVE